MKYCSKCGKELLDDAVVCPGCGCAIKQQSVKKDVSYDDCVKNAATTNIVAAVILAVGVLCGLFVSVLIGCILCLVAELVVLAPNSKVQKALKANVKTTDKKEYKMIAKQVTKDLKSNYSAYKWSFILAYIALAGVIVFAVMI
ncbi:MAG: zinc-ribbon domain-containing protein [Oscillospiraceae bacterium]|nr:zinc-ribbon domain-containing protein [Oscillospiraceae bacterium]MBQ9930631.1 zinc-ribbon domain-containing protein [Oscillospiraceae bacterium]